MSASDVDLAVVVVAYRCRDDVARCVASVLDGALDHRIDVVVVDNDSRDGTVEVLAARGDVRVIEMGENAGFARASNRGIAATDSRHVMLLNPDTEVEVGALDRLVDHLDEHPEVGAVAPRLIFPDGRDQLTARAFPTPAAAVFGRRSPLTRLFPRNRWSSRFLTGRDHVGDEPFGIDWVSGACLAAPRRVVDEVGALDEGYFLYWEDADWCRRIKGAGYEVVCVPKARVVHDEGATRGHGWPTPVVVHFHRGAYRYWRLHHAPQPWNPARWAAATGLAARAVLVVVRNRVRDRVHERARRPGSTVPPATSRSTPVPDKAAL